MKKTAIIGAILSAALLVGCGSTETSHTVSTDGSTSMEKVIGILSESYTEKHQNVKVTYNPIPKLSLIRRTTSAQRIISADASDDS